MSNYCQLPHRIWDSEIPYFLPCRVNRAKNINHFVLFYFLKVNRENASVKNNIQPADVGLGAAKNNI